MGFNKLTSQQIRVQICRYFFVRKKQTNKIKKERKILLIRSVYLKKISLLTNKTKQISGEAHAEKKDIAIYFKKTNKQNKTKTNETETEKIIMKWYFFVVF